MHLISSIIDSNQHESLADELEVPFPCIQKHIVCNYQSEELLFLNGNSNCKLCSWLCNIIFDLNNFVIYNTSFSHKVHFKKNIQSSIPILLFSLIFINDKWYIVSENKLLNYEYSINGLTYEEIFYNSWGYNDLSLLSKSEYHFFYKRIEDIIMNKKDMSYIMSVKRRSNISFTNGVLSKAFPESPSKLYFRFTNNYIEFTTYIDESYSYILFILLKTNCFKKTFIWAKENNQIDKLLALFPNSSLMIGELLLKY